MGRSHFSSVAAQVATELRQIRATELRQIRIADAQTAIVDRDAEYQRVNGYVADCLKESNMLYSKLARLQSDFAGHELRELEEISEKVLEVGEALSHFAKAFYEGKANMAESSVVWGDSGGAPVPNPDAKAPPPPPQADIPITVEDEPPPPAQEPEPEQAA